MYINDAWYQLLRVQLLFTFTDDMCILLRWITPSRFDHLRSGIRFAHIFFNVLFERDTLCFNSPACWRSCLFLIYDCVCIFYICRQMEWHSHGAEAGNVYGSLKREDSDGKYQKLDLTPGGLPLQLVDPGPYLHASVNGRHYFTRARLLAWGTVTLLFSFFLFFGNTRYSR